MRSYKFFLLIVILCTSPTSALECNYTGFTDCYAKYFEWYKFIPPFPNPPAYTVFEDVNAHIIKNEAWNGQQQICSNQVNLLKCLEKEDPGCVNSFTLQQSLYMPLPEAKSYETDFYVRAFQCTKGYNCLHNEFYCLMKVQLYRLQELSVCENIGESAYNHNGFGLNCGSVNKTIACYEDVYTRYCGLAVKSYICNIIKIPFNRNNDICENNTIQC